MLFRSGCYIDLFDAEKDRYPYPDGRFDMVLCCELLEHLSFDPMHMMAEINRVLKQGGHLVLTTPNITSLRALEAVLQGSHPGLYSAYIKPDAQGWAEPRHNREYAPPDLKALFESAGFEVTLMETGWYWQPTAEDKIRNERMTAWLRQRDRKSTRLNSSHIQKSRMPSSA